MTSAPYASPVIDGDPGDWKEAIPVTFTTGGRTTTISTVWKRKGFSILVAVEEAALILPGERAQFDAVQFALAEAELSRDKEIVLVGVLDHFEIWSRENFEKESLTLENELRNPEARNEIAKLGI